MTSIPIKLGNIIREIDLEQLNPPSIRRGLQTILTNGGDERIAVDPSTHRNQYGTSPIPVPHEPSFGSSTSSSITPRGFLAAERSWRALIDNPVREGGSLPDFFDGIRGQLNRQFGAHDSDIILCASGTQTEFLALALALGSVGDPLTNIVIAPSETGRGVLNAAAGAHFLGTAPFGGNLQPGARLAGWDSMDIIVERVEIRNAGGELRCPVDLNQEILGKAADALARGRSVLLHILDVSKTGLGAVDLELARQIQTLAPERVVVVVDCCQLRSSPSRVRKFLGYGFMIAITGSKFAGGPSFSGALIVPREIRERLTGLKLPIGLAVHSALHDWPERMRPMAAGNVGAAANIGLGLRWVAALSEIELFGSFSMPLLRRIVDKFKQTVLNEADLSTGLIPIVFGSSADAEWADTIISIILRNDDGSPHSYADAVRLQGALRDSHSGDDPLGQRFHVGQPVAIGKDIALRVCLSGPCISDVAARVEDGEDLPDAFAPLGNDIRRLFEKWRTLRSLQGGWTT